MVKPLSAPAFPQRQLNYGILIINEPPENVDRARQLLGEANEKTISVRSIDRELILNLPEPLYYLEGTPVHTREDLKYYAPRPRGSLLSFLGEDTFKKLPEIVQTEELKEQLEAADKKKLDYVWSTDMQEGPGGTHMPASNLWRWVDEDTGEMLPYQEPPPSFPLGVFIFWLYGKNGEVHPTVNSKKPFRQLFLVAIFEEWLQLKQGRVYAEVGLPPNRPVKWSNTFNKPYDKLSKLEKFFSWDNDKKPDKVYEAAKENAKLKTISLVDLTQHILERGTSKDLPF